MKRKATFIGAAIAAIALIATLAACAGQREKVDTRPPVADKTAGAELDTSGAQGFAISNERESAASAGAVPAAGRAATGSVAATGAPPTTGDAKASGDAAAGYLDRKIIQSASLDLQVEEVGRAFEEVGRIAATAGGFVASSTFSSVGDKPVASVTIRVPANRYQAVLKETRDLGVKVENEKSGANDVTEEFTDLEARLRTLQATEERYLELLARAKDIGDILQVQDRLNGVRLEIERVQGRMNAINNLTDLATIAVHLKTVPPAPEPTPPSEPGKPDPLQMARDSWEASLNILRTIAGGFLAGVVFVWWMVPPVLLVALIARLLLRQRPRPVSQTMPSGPASET